MAMKTNEAKQKILIGNSFPFSLIRCKRMLVESQTLASLRKALLGAEVVSFWGHENTRVAAESVLGVSLVPRMERPAVTLAPDKRPMLYGEVFDVCWLLSPDYPEGFRPPIGEEVSPDHIEGWHVLKLTWQ